MKIATNIIRYILGILFLVFGLNGFFNFIPMGAPSAEAGAFMGALAATGYMFPVIKIIEIAAGVLLLANRFVPAALVILAPISVNIFLLHLLLDPSGLPVGIFVLGGNFFLLFAYRQLFKPLTEPKPETVFDRAEVSS